MSLTHYLHSKGYSHFEGYSQECPNQVEELKNIVKQYSIKNIMEIGFNAGHSAEVFLSTNSDITLTSFDIGTHDYLAVGKEYIDQQFPNRHTLVLGDSTISIPEFSSKNHDVTYDLIFIDGCHLEEYARKDLINSFKLAHKDTIVIMDDTVTNPAYIHMYNPYPLKVWDEAINNNLVKEIQRKDFAPGRGMCWGTYIFNT